jgi:TetR/AcrR family transcriptional repressor of nem operon
MTDETETKKPSKTQLKILKTAKDMLWQRGYGGTSLNDLVAKAKISKGGLFHYYPNKKSVTIAVLENYFIDHIAKVLEKHMEGTHDAMSVKVALLNWLEQTYKTYHAKDFKEGCMLGNFALETADSDEELRELMKVMFIAWENQLVAFMKPLAQDGKLLMDARQFSRLLIAMIEGITMTCKVHRDHIRASRDFQAVAEFIERMIRD